MSKIYTLNHTSLSFVGSGLNLTTIPPPKPLTFMETNMEILIGIAIAVVCVTLGAALGLWVAYYITKDLRARGGK